MDSEDKSVGYAVVFVEGWNIPEREEDLTPPEVKVEAPEEPPAAPEPEVERRWICPACTLENEMASDICMVCESAKPANPVLTGEVVEEMVEQPKEDLPATEIETVRVKVWHASFEKRLQEIVEKQNQQAQAEVDAKRAERNQLLEAAKANDQAKKQPKKPDGTQEDPGVPEATLPDIPDPVKKPIPSVALKFGTETLTTPELEEAMLNRMVMDEYQNALDDLLDREYAVRKDFIDQTLGVASKEDFFSCIKESVPADCIQNLAKIGIDIWLDKVVDEALLQAPLSDAEIKELINMIEKDTCAESRFFSYFKSSNIRVLEKNPIILKNQGSSLVNAKENIGFQKLHGIESKYPTIKDLSTAQLRASWEKIARYNKLFLEVLPLINLSAQSHAKMGSEVLTLGGYVTGLRQLCLSHVKSTIKTEIMQKTALSSERTPSLKIQRLTEDPEEKAKEGEAKVTNQSLWKMKTKFTFLKAFDQLKKIPLTMLRPEKVKGSGSFVAFEVDLEGENVQGLAGPYRQFFADISSELQPSITKSAQKQTLGMFIPTPNAEHKAGEDRHKFTINPSANSSYYLQLFEGLGVLMGCAMRTDCHFTLDLTSIFWKKIIGEELAMLDLELLDKHFVDNMRILESCDKTQFEQLGLDNFVTKLSDGTIFELIPNGSNTKVSFERKNEFIELCIKARLDEANKQIEAISRGIFKIVPEPYFKIITWKDLEAEICGSNQVDFKLLKRNTIYSGTIKEDSDLIRNFWVVLNEMNISDKLRFIKFCWGQERLPTSDDEYKRTQTRFMVKPSMNTTVDQNTLLPKADTCFFNLELPNYATKESMQEKILLAINFDCDSLNAEIVINEFNDDGQNHNDMGDE